MNIEIILEGKLKESCFKTGFDEFKKRLTGYIDLKLVEVSDMNQFIETTKKQDYIITLEIEGKMLTSPEFAEKIRQIETDGFYNKILFLIGGSEGLSDYVKQKSNFKFSMSKLTFLHQEACLILIEQIYRAFKILKNEPYHK